MGLEARETREGLFSQRARVSVRIPFPSKFESVSFAAAQAMLPDPTREHCVTTARAAAKKTKFEYKQCYVVNVVFELGGKESQLGY